jgi:hypothetical protein
MRAGTAASTAPRPNVRDDGQRPSFGTGWQIIALLKNGIIFAEGAGQIREITAWGRSDLPDGCEERSDSLPSPGGELSLCLQTLDRLPHRNEADNNQDFNQDDEDHRVNSFKLVQPARSSERPG